MLKRKIADVPRHYVTGWSSLDWVAELRFALAFLMLIGCSGLAFGQMANTGTISGNVTDIQGSSVVGATITILNSVTNAQRTEKSNARGEYIFSDVAVGTYTLSVTMTGFETYVVDSIQVDSDQNVLQDAALHPGSVTQQVTVEAKGTTIDARSATLGAMLDKNMVENLPVDGNNVVSLAALLPGVNNVNAPTTFTSDVGGPTFNISGARNNQNLFLLDGQLWNNLFYNTGLNFPPPFALQEVSILLNNYKAQYGRNVGSVMNVLTRSGSDQLHGELWEYMQNKALNAADYISQINPGLVQNQFGATIGGPLKRDKVFFFLSVQDLRVAQTVFSHSETLTPEERGYDVAPTATSPGTPHMCQYPGFAGMQCGNYSIDFPTTAPAGLPAGVLPQNYYLRNPLESSTYADGFVSAENAAWQQAGNTGNSPCYTLLNNLYTSNPGAPYNKDYLPYEELPAVCFNPVSVAFLNAYVPYPNAVNTAGFPVLNATAKQPRNDWDGLARMDFSLGRNTVDARFYVTNVNDVTSNSATNSGSAPGIASYEQDANSGGIYYGNIGDTYVLTPNLLNIVKLGYKRYGYLIYPTDHTTLQSFGAAINQPAYVASLPEVEVENRFRVGSTNSTWSWTVNEDEELDDSLSWTHSNHNFMFGMQYLHLQYLHRFDATPFVESGLSFTEADASDFMAGLLAEVQVANFTNLGALQNDFYMYGQDDWRATPRLTLNYGLRYELPFAWRSADGQGVTFSPGFQSTVVPSAPLGLGYDGDPAPGNALLRSRYNNLAPRSGFAYDVKGNGSTILRGGFGIFFDAINANVVGVGAPFHYSASYIDPPGGMSQPLLGESPIAPNYTKGNAYFGLPYSVNYADPNLTTPYTEAINFGIEQRVRTTGMLELDYVAKFGHHEMIQFDRNSDITAYDTNPSDALFGQCTGPYNAAVFGGLYCPTTTTIASTSEQQRVTYPNYAYGGQGVVDNATIGNSNYNGLQILYTQRARDSLHLIASYTYSKSLDIQSNGQTNTANVPQPKDLASQYALSDFNSKQILNLGWVYNLPKTALFDAPVRAVVNGWVFGGIYNAQTGMPINVTLAGDTSFTGDRPQRPEATPGVNPNLPSNRPRAEKVQAWFNNTVYAEPDDASAAVLLAGAEASGAAFYTPQIGTFGNVGRNSLIGPAFIATHFSLSRIFTMPERGTTLEFKADAFNVFNTPNLANPGSVLSTATSNSVVNTFGVVQSTVGTNGSVGTNGRRCQLALILRY